MNEDIFEFLKYELSRLLEDIDVRDVATAEKRVKYIWNELQLGEGKSHGEYYE